MNELSWTGALSTNAQYILQALLPCFPFFSDRSMLCTMHCGAFCWPSLTLPYEIGCLENEKLRHGSGIGQTSMPKFLFFKQHASWSTQWNGDLKVFCSFYITTGTNNLQNPVSLVQSSRTLNKVNFNDSWQEITEYGTTWKKSTRKLISMAYPRPGTVNASLAPAIFTIPPSEWPLMVHHYPSWSTYLLLCNLPSHLGWRNFLTWADAAKF